MASQTKKGTSVKQRVIQSGDGNGTIPQLAKSPSGIAGLDEITGGGLPTGRPTLICGSAGCGNSRPYILRLYVTGTTPNSMRAIENVKRICEEHLAGRYDLQIIDIYQQPTLAKGEQIIAAPTLIKKLPAPLRRVIGDLSNHERVLLGLNVRPKE